MTNNTFIQLYSKDKKSLKQFIKFLKNIKNQWKNLIFSVKHKKKKRRRITILKSPHVNKKAQTKLQSIIYSTNIKCFSLNLKKNYIILKKIKNHLFPDLKIKIEQTIFDKKAKHLKNNLFLPQTLYYYQKAETFSNKQKQKKKLLTFKKQPEKRKIILKKTLHFLKILDHYGNS